MKVLLQLSDPWAMGEALGWPSIFGTAIYKSSDCWLVEIDEPFVYDSVEYRFVVISARHEGKHLASAASETVSCNMVRTTTELAASKSPCDLSSWRGGHAMIGSVRGVMPNNSFKPKPLRGSA